MINNKSEHILSSSINLLGFCLIVLTSLKIYKIGEKNLLDEITGIAALFLITSTVFSFISIRTKNQNQAEKFEKLADIFFFIALFLVFLIITLITFYIAF